MKAILYFVLIGAVIGIWIFSSVPALYWTLYAAFIVSGIKIIDNDNVKQLNQLLATTNLFLFLKLASLLIWSSLTGSYFGPLEVLYPWSIGISAVFTFMCLIFGYIARYNMSKEAQLRDLEPLEEELGEEKVGEEKE